jgi:hypothetical protein
LQISSFDKGFEKNPKNQFCSEDNEVFDFIEAHEDVIELNKSHKIVKSRKLHANLDGKNCTIRKIQ